MHMIEWPGAGDRMDKTKILWANVFEADIKAMKFSLDDFRDQDIVIYYSKLSYNREGRITFSGHEHISNESWLISLSGNSVVVDKLVEIISNFSIVGHGGKDK